MTKTGTIYQRFNVFCH